MILRTAVLQRKLRWSWTKSCSNSHDMSCFAMCFIIVNKFQLSCLLWWTWLLLQIFVPWIVTNSNYRVCYSERGFSSKSFSRESWKAAVASSLLNDIVTNNNFLRSSLSTLSFPLSNIQFIARSMVSSNWMLVNNLHTLKDIKNFRQEFKGLNFFLSFFISRFSSIEAFNYKLAKQLVAILSPHIANHFCISDLLSFVHEVKSLNSCQKFLVFF